MTENNPFEKAVSPDEIMGSVKLVTMKRGRPMPEELVEPPDGPARRLALRRAQVVKVADDETSGPTYKMILPWYDRMRFRLYKWRLWLDLQVHRIQLHRWRKARRNFDDQ